MMNLNLDEAKLTCRIDNVMHIAIDEKRIVGGSVAVFYRGRCIFNKSSGLADRELGAPMRRDQLYRYASVTKVVTAIAAMALIDQGRLSLDDHVSKWLPSFHPAMADGKRYPITIRHLLTMTCGLSYGIAEEGRKRYGAAGVSNGLDATRIDLDDAMVRLSNAGLVARPGERWEYSLGLDVLGAVIAKVAKTSFPKAVGELVTDRLDIVDTGFELVDPDRLAVPYVSGTPEPTRMRDVEPIEFPGFGTIIFEPRRAFLKDVFPSGGAGMIGTCYDMALVLDELCRGGGKLLSSETAVSMMSNQIGDLPTLLGPGWGWGFGAGVLIDPARAESPQSAGTFQWSGAYGNTWFVDRAQQLTVVSMTNTAPEGDIGLFPILIRDAVYARDGSSTP
jgi:CubicO group peptidase (beta-lactamase class C family)